MPEISQRAELMPASPIRKLVPLAEAARSRGIRIYHLNIGQPDLPSPQTGLAALKKIDRNVLEYSPSDGYRSLREKLAGYYQQYQIKLSPEEIIVTTGGSEAVLFAFMSCLNPGDEIIVPEPAYANYMAFAISAGAVIRPVVSSIEQGFALPDVAEFEKLINERTRGILICNPNNPTGYLYTRKEMERIRDLVKKYDLFLFSDEVYREFIYTGSPYISACHLEGVEQNVVLRNGYSGLTLKGPSNIVARNNIFMENHYYGVYADPAAGQTKIEYNNIYKNYYPFNRFIKVNRTNVSLDPRFINPSLFKPNFYCNSKSPMLKRGKGKLDIGLLAHEVVEKKEEVAETRNPDTDGDGMCDPWVSEEGKADQYSSICTGTDNCPEDKEDVDGFQDDDGCPDPDNDRDGVCDPWSLRAAFLISMQTSAREPTSARNRKRR